MAMVPTDPDLDELRATAATCTACDLYRNATQTVFGKGLTRAQVMLVGEQPGDKEDVEGEPFVGPAGRLLNEALTAAGIDRDEAYVTNVVKHFKFEQRGKRRIHKKPNMSEIKACRPWLEAEIEVVQPTALVCLGATAAQALLGRTFRVTQHRGELVESDLAPLVTATIHPSAILRAPDERETEMKGLIEDLTMVRKALAKL
jgi:uracil-DNA glycosylase family protein